MAERIYNEEAAGSSDNGRLRVFCEYFVKNIEKNLTEIEVEATVNGTPKTGRKGTATNHREISILIYEKLRLIKEDKDFRQMLVSAAGEIFWCFQNQFLLVNDERDLQLRGMDKLSSDAVSRFFNYISSYKQKKINCETFCDCITEGIILGKSKSKHKIKYQNKLYNTSALYDDVGILEINQDESRKYHNRKGSSGEFSYRFPFSWENFKEFSVKTYASDEEPIIPCDLTKNMLKQQLRNILRIINGEDKNDQHKTKHVWFDMRKPVTTFTGRIEILETLYQTLHNANATGSAVISQTTSVSGLGGIGKSELSRKYAIQYEDAYDGNLIWINSETHESLKDSFTRLAKKLQIPVTEKGTVQKEKVRDVASIVEDVYTRFGKGKCLFIFDNAEEYKIIKEFLPSCLPSNIQKPHILITSRNQKWQLADTGAINVINLEYFTSNEALDFIKKALEIKNNLSDDEIKTLAKELDYFPLALGQAVAYIIMKDEREKMFHGKTFGVSDYLKAYKDESLKAKLLEHRHENSQYNKTVLTTWNITLKNIEKENKGSIKIIEIMAYLVPDSIKPDKIFLKSIKVKEDSISNKINKIMSSVFPDFIKPDVSFSELTKDKGKRQDAIYLLLNYSMINIKDQVLSIHRLVQEVIRLQIKGKGRDKDVLKNALELLGFDLRTVDETHLISVWSYACDYGEIIDEFFFKYESFFYNKTTPFNLIVESGNIDAVKKILNYFKKKSNETFQEILNSTKYHIATPLDISIRQNNVEMVKLLSEFGAKKNNKICVKSIFDGRVDLVKYFYPNNDEYLLHAKLYSALRSKNVESVNNLLKDLENEQIKNLMELKITNLDPKLFIYEWPPLFFAARSGNLDLVKLLVINYGADINFSCNLGTSLHATVDSWHLEKMKFLIENGANCNAVDYNGWTVLHYAALYGKLEIVKYLIENNKCDINATNNEGKTALDYATKFSKLEVVEYLTKKLNERKLI